MFGGKRIRMNERHKKMLAMLEERGEMDVAALSEALEASEATIRRDLSVLESDGKLQRTFGGAKIRPASSLLELTFQHKREQMRSEKERIARTAAGLVKPGMTIGIDSGTTAWRFAAALRGKSPLTVISSALAAVEELGAVKGVSIFCTGGNFRLENLDFTGPTTLAAIEKLHLDLAFISADGFIPGKGAFTTSEDSAAIGRKLVECSDKSIVAFDHSKLNGRAPYRVAEVENIDYLITDSGISEKIKKLLESGPYKLITA